MSAVQTFGKKKTATAVAHVTPGRGLVRLNGSPISLVEPEIQERGAEDVAVSGRRGKAGRTGVAGGRQDGDALDEEALRKEENLSEGGTDDTSQTAPAARTLADPSALLRYKVYEPILVVGPEKLANIDIRLRVKGGGHVSQLYALRQAIAKGVVAFYAKNEDAASALELKKTLIAYDRSLLVADPRRMEPKKFGGRGARARRQKSYR